MSYFVQKATLANGSLTANFNLLSGRTNLPENIILVYKGGAALESDELLNIYGYVPGEDTVITAGLVSQITVAADDAVRVDLSSAAKGCWKIQAAATALDAGDEIEVTVVTW